jgi:hypothetical protein
MPQKLSHDAGAAVESHDRLTAAHKRQRIPLPATVVIGALYAYCYIDQRVHDPGSGMATFPRQPRKAG